jgi:UDP-3-O-[3-hydroxymyristoyl] glucosamine N-acyltransferase
LERQVGVADNLTIGEGARVGAQSEVTADIPAGKSWLGSPAKHSPGTRGATR